MASMKSSIWRIACIIVDLSSLAIFSAAWVASIVLSGFSLSNSNVFAAWTYFPLLWPHLLAATLGLLVSLRFVNAGNYVTALVTIVLYVVAFFSDLYAAVCYTRTFWLCNIKGASQLDFPVGQHICHSENALLIILTWGVAILLWVLTWFGIPSHGFDFNKAGKSGSSKPLFGNKFTAPLGMLLFVGLAGLVIVLGLYIENAITSAISVSGGHTYASWAYINIFLLEISGLVLSLMLFLRYGSNWATAAAAIVIWCVSVFAAYYVGYLYWKVGWMCWVSKTSVLTGLELVMCTQESGYFIAIWILSTAFGLVTIGGSLGHIWDFFSAGRSGSIDLRSHDRKEDEYVENMGIDSEDAGGAGMSEYNDGKQFPVTSPMPNTHGYKQVLKEAPVVQAAQNGWNHAVNNIRSPSTRTHASPYARYKQS